MSKAATDRRRFVRHARILDASWGGESQPIDHLVAVWDISRGGVLLHDHSPFDVGALLTIRIYNASGKSLDRKLRVVRLQEHGHGAWHIGGKFELPLTEEELKFLLYDARPPSNLARSTC
ncbi:MAG: hypothetical protein KatS3mg105_3643 [Gemmatales bacterium]|nr:MAG: hypothetical protein KatS3mg105_3643 [Gemmatales bacterium]